MQSPCGSPKTEPGMRRQSRAMSLVECLTNVIVGYGVAVLVQVIVFPLFGLRLPVRDNLAIGAVFTAVSIARSYLLRRFFETLRVRRSKREAAARGSGGGPVVSMSPGNRQPAIR